MAATTGIAESANMIAVLPRLFDLKSRIKAHTRAIDPGSAFPRILNIGASTPAALLGPNS
jgi:hypothetical protein